VNAPTIYNAHPLTLECIGQGLADPDPLDSGNWLIPAFAYIDAPQEPIPGFAVIRDVNRNTWVQVEDNRGTVYDVATGAPQEYTALGPLPLELTYQPFPGAFHDWDGNAWALDPEAQHASELAQKLTQRDERLSSASMRIAPLQDAVDLGEATEQEQMLLRAWKRYRIELGRLEQQPGFPLSIEWPLSPEYAVEQPLLTDQTQ
jgi:hypothetical protein